MTSSDRSKPTEHFEKSVAAIAVRQTLGPELSEFAREHFPKPCGSDTAEVVVDLDLAQEVHQPSRRSCSLPARTPLNSMPTFIEIKALDHGLKFLVLHQGL